MAATPDLRVLCRRLTATAAADLPAICPSLVAHVLRCAAPLSAPHEGPKKDSSSEAAVLVHKLRTNINTLLTGRSLHGRFTAAILVKAVVDTGGWESLRSSEPWVRGLLSALQKSDPPASKELYVVTLTRIYMLLHPYQTLTREIATPTLPSFVNACLQLLKAAGPGRFLKVPMTLAHTVLGALATLVPLYPTTLRPFVSQIRSAIKPLAAPTRSDGLTVAPTVSHAARRLLALFHYTTPKNGNADEWGSALATFIREAHGTLDEVFRAVQESWESTSGYTPSQRRNNHEGEPSGGVDNDAGSSNNTGNTAHGDFPAWQGVQAGSERLVGLLALVSQCLESPTKTPVTVPLGAIVDLVARVTSVLAPSQNSDGTIRENAQTHASIGREEKDELWTALLEMHRAAVALLAVAVTRLGPQAKPFASEMLDMAVRVFASAQQLATLRETTYRLVAEILILVGPTLAKVNVGVLDPVIHACCHDLLAVAGFLQHETQQQEQQQQLSANQKKANAPKSSLNADMFLKKNSNNSSSGNAAGGDTGSLSSTLTSSLSATHQAAAQALLGHLFTYLPQPHLRKAQRALLDRTAILSRDRTALVASALHPYVDRAGRPLANTLPFLAAEYPRDQGIEILRTNLRLKPCYFEAGDGDDGGGDDDHEAKDRDDDGRGHLAPSATAASFSFQPGSGGAWGGSSDNTSNDTKPGAGGFGLAVQPSTSTPANPATVTKVVTASSTLIENGIDGHPVSVTMKRKSEEPAAAGAEPTRQTRGSTAKRRDTGEDKSQETVRGGRTTRSAEAATTAPLAEQVGQENHDSDSEGSVHLDMALDEDEEDEDDEDE